MKNVTLKIADDNGNLFKEDSIQISEGSKLIIKYPSEKYTYKQLYGIKEYINAFLSGEKEFLLIPDDIKLQVMEID